MFQERPDGVAGSQIHVAYIDRDGPSSSTIGVDSLRVIVRPLPEKWACLRSDEDLEL